MITGETITDAQIRELGTQLVEAGLFCDAMWCDIALIAERDRARFDISHGCSRPRARAHCAKVLNARGGQ